MTVSVPVTIWAPTDGNGEMGQSTGATIETESESVLTTEAGTEIVIEDASLTTIPATVWVENDSQ
jgi:hypothetical protein